MQVVTLHRLTDAATATSEQLREKAEVGLEAAIKKRKVCSSFNFCFSVEDSAFTPMLV